MKFIIYNFLLLTALAMIPNSFSKTDCSERSTIKADLEKAEKKAGKLEKELKELQEELESKEE